jgi:hypothetical protein
MLGCRRIMYCRITLSGSAQAQYPAVTGGPVAPQREWVSVIACPIRYMDDPIRGTDK